MGGSPLPTASFTFTRLYSFILCTCGVLILTHHSSYSGGKTQRRLSSFQPLSWARFRVLYLSKAFGEVPPPQQWAVAELWTVAVLWRALGVGGGEGGNYVYVVLYYIMCLWCSLQFRVLSTSLCWCLKLEDSRSSGLASVGRVRWGLLSSGEGGNAYIISLGPSKAATSHFSL